MKKKRKVLHLISQAHIDPVWLWPWRDGCAEALTTMQSAVDRAREFPEFRFTRSSAETYRWAKRADPRLFGEIAELVACGRWEAVGGWVEQPDCNLPSTESFARQSLYGKGFFERELHCETRIGYNVDSFGHSGGLPQLLNQAGFDRYVFMRPEPYENPGIPPLFWWEGADGSRVLALRVPVAYCQSPAAGDDDIERAIREAERKNFPGGGDHGVFFLGVGNHGGGPTRSHLRRIVRLQKDPSLPELRFSSLKDYFACVDRSGLPGRLPVVRGELQHHARGCYSATGEVKAANRRAEQSLVVSEMLDCIEGKPAPSPETGEAWWRLLFNQFHDILGGSCTADTLPETMHRFGSSVNCASERALEAAHRLARRVDTRKEKGSVLFVCNPLPWKRRAVVQCDTFRRQDVTGSPITHLQDARGKRHPIQWMKADAGFGPWMQPWAKLSAAVDVPPCGYAVFRLVSGKGGGKPAPPRPRFGKKGVDSLRAEDAAELLAAPLRLAAFRDESDTWAHGADVLGEELGRAALLSSKVVEEGAALTVTRYHYAWKASRIDLDVVSGRHDEAVELRFRINWQEKREILRLQVPTRLRGAVALSQAAGGVARREAVPGEQPCQDWVALEGTVGGRRYSVALINGGSYSYAAKGGLLEMILVRSAAFAEHAPHRCGDAAAFLDQGWQERRFWVLGYRGEAGKRPLHRLALDLQTSPEVLLDSGHPGTEPWTKSTLEVRPASVFVTAWKPAENGKGSILRIQETTGRGVTAKIVLPERKRTFRVALAPWEIATLRITGAGKDCRCERCDFLERSTRPRASGPAKERQSTSTGGRRSRVGPAFP